MVEIAIAIMSFLRGVVSIGRLFVFGKRTIGERKYISWKDIDTATENLYKMILESNYEPDMMVGVGRGGAVAAGLVAARFRVRSTSRGRMIPIAMVDRIYVKEEERRKDVLIVGIHNLEVHGKKLLLLNADSRSGETLRTVIEKLKWDRPSVIRTGSLINYYEEDHTAYEPDYYGVKLPWHKSWKKLPWRAEEYPVDEGQDFRHSGLTVVVLHGLVATGKTSTTYAIAKGLHYTPVYSDWYWFKYGKEDRAENPYTNERHNNHMIDLCLSVIGTGFDAVLDCTSRIKAFRGQIMALFSRYNVSVIFVLCHCNEDTSLDRVNMRKYIGPYDFGTKYEYERVKGTYEPIEDPEAKHMNLIDVDTDNMTCTIKNCVGGVEIENKMEGICHAIEQHYFSKIYQP